MNPATLSIIAATFPPRERGTAIGIWAGTSALALAIGPLVGGLITEHLEWSWIFFVNIPIGILGIVASYLFIDESRDETHASLDLPGLATSAIGLFALTYGLIEANTYGWTSARIVGAFVLAVVALASFVVIERRRRDPMLPLELFRNGTYTGANLVVLLVALAMFGVFFFVSLYMQNILGYSAVQAGAAFLPMTLLIILVAPIAGRTSDRIGSRGLMTAGMVLVAGQLILFSRLGVDSTFWNLLPALMIGGVGMALTMTPSAAAATRSVPVDKAGVGSAVLNCARQIGGTMGIAVMGAIMASQAGGVRSVDAFMDGFQTALLVAAGIAIAGAVVAFTLVRPHEGAGERAGPPARARARRVERRVGRRARGPKGDSFARRPVAACACTARGRGAGGGKRRFPRELKTPPAAAPGAFPVRGDPFPGWRAGESWLCGPATFVPCPPTNPAVVPAHPIWRPIVCGVGLTIGAVSRKVK